MSENPFLSRERFPRFDELTPEAAREALPVLIAETEAKVAALTDALEPFSRAWHLVGHMLGVRNSDAWRAVEEELQPHVVKTRSNCTRRNVAAVIVKDRRIISTGYNGAPRGVRNCNEGGCPRCASDAPSGTALGDCICSHAEENAIT